MNASTLTLPVLPSAWRRPLLALCAILLLVVLSYYDTAAAMVGIWNRSETFAHAFVVPPLSLWLIWRRRGVLAGLPTYPVPWLAAPMLLLVATWLLGDLVGVDALTQLMLVAMLVLAVPALLGWAVARELIFPLGFLFFAVPLGEFMTPWLMQYTADFTVAALRASGVPVYREGLKFVIPSGSWSVVEACSGIRYLIASVMVGTLFAYLNYRSLWRRWAFVGVAIAVPIGANWLRAYMIVMLGHLSDNRLATGVDHLVYGWVFFGVVILAMFLIGARWSEPDDPADAVAAQGPVRGDAATASRWASCVLLLAVVIAVPPWAARSLLDNRPALSLNAADPLRLPTRLAGDWHAASGGALPPLTPVYEGASQQVSALYAKGQREVGVHIAYYDKQDKQHKLVSSVNTIVRADDPLWNLLRSGTQHWNSKAGAMTVRTADLSAPGSGASPLPVRVWHFYWIGDRLTHSDIEAKLLQAWQQLQGKGSAGAAVVVYTADNDNRAADDVLTGFMNDNYSLIDRSLRAMRTPGQLGNQQNSTP